MTFIDPMYPVLKRERRKFCLKQMERYREVAASLAAGELPDKKVKVT